MIIGITGSLGTGKTTVARMFRKLGAHVIDADKIVHRIMRRDLRKRIAAFVFKDDMALKRLCAVIHPLVKGEIRREIKENRARKAIVIDAPLLIEAGLHKKCRFLVVVKAAQATQLRRGRKSLGLSQQQLKQRIAFQMPLKQKIKMADFIIDNEGSLEKTQRQVRKIWQSLPLSRP